MNILVASYDIIPEKSHLMPWRYVCEAVKYFKSMNHSARIISISNESKCFTLEKEGLVVDQINKSPDVFSTQLQNMVDKHEADVLFWPVSFRESRYKLHALAQLNLPVVGYFPGGIYRFSDVFYAIRRIGFRASLPYLVEAIMPKSARLKSFHKSGIRHLITLSQYTAEVVSNSGWSREKVTPTLPGKESESGSLSSENSKLPVEFTTWLDGSNYLIFMGPPTPIRGGYELLSAFDLAASKLPDIKLVCLFRSDVGIDMSDMKQFISTLNNKNRIFAVWQSLSRDELETFILNSYAIALPFLLVPSEIPLAVIDSASYGKPVITTNCGGTGHFVEKFGVTVSLTDLNEFSDKIIKLFSDGQYYSNLTAKVKSMYQSHPAWDDMSQQWLTVAENVVSESPLKCE